MGFNWGEFYPFYKGLTSLSKRISGKGESSLYFSCEVGLKLRPLLNLPRLVATSKI